MTIMYTLFMPRLGVRVQDPWRSPPSRRSCYSAIMSIGCRVNVNVNARNYAQSNQCERMARVKEHLKNVEKNSRKEAQQNSRKEQIIIIIIKGWPGPTGCGTRGRVGSGPPYVGLQDPT